ncbi:MAG: fructose-bisphosphatase class II family protein, partial [Tissierellales bacterium]
IAVGPKVKGKVNLDMSIAEIIRNAAEALNKSVSDITVTMLDRPRHQKIMEEVRKAGARIKLFTDGDVAAAIATCFENSGVDILLGIGGAPEGVIAAAAIKCLGGDFQGRLHPMNDEEIERCKKMGISDVNKLFTLDDLVKGNEVMFAATGVTDGELLKGVVYYENNRARTSSVVMRAETGTVRFIESIHRLDKKPNYAK